MGGQGDGGRGAGDAVDRRTGAVDGDAGAGEPATGVSDKAVDGAIGGAADAADIVDVLVTREPVELYKVLKFEGLAGSGGEAKGFVDAGLVSVNGTCETRRRRKLVDGDRVAFAGTTLRIRRA